MTTGVFGVIKTIGALLWAFWWVDRYGRKAVLVVGSIGGAVGMLVIAAILGATNPAAKKPAPTSLPPSGGAAVAFFYIWTAFYAIGCKCMMMYILPPRPKLTINSLLQGTVLHGSSTQNPSQDLFVSSPQLLVP